MRIPWLLNPAVWFVIDQLRISLGTLFFLECDQIHEDVIYLFVMLSFLVFFISGTGVTKAISSCSPKKIRQWRDSPVQIESGQIFNTLLWVIIITSIIISVLYYYAVGYNLFLSGIYSLLTGTGGVEDAETMRLYAYASDVYFAPGYVNQFKNTLLPLLVTYIAISSFLLGRRRGLIWAVLLTPAVIIFLLGTGQRGAFLVAAFCFIIFLLNVIRRLKRRYILLSLVTIISLFMLSSLILGRSTKDIKDVNDLLSLSMEIPSRLFEANQISGVEGFRYIYSKPTAWGTEWLSEVSQMIPGLKKSDNISIAAQIHKIMFGSARGTAPPSIAGSLWLNFHILGVTIFPFLLGMIYQAVYHRLVIGPKSLFRLLIFSAITGVLGLWGAGGIGTLLDLGLPTILLLYILGNRALKIGRSRRVYNHAKLAMPTFPVRQV